VIAEPANGGLRSHEAKLTGKRKAEGFVARRGLELLQGGLDDVGARLPANRKADPLPFHNDGQLVLSAREGDSDVLSRSNLQRVAGKVRDGALELLVAEPIDARLAPGIVGLRVDDHDCAGTVIADLCQQSELVLGADLEPRGDDVAHPALREEVAEVGTCDPIAVRPGLNGEGLGDRRHPRLDPRPLVPKRQVPAIVAAQIPGQAIEEPDF